MAIKPPDSDPRNEGKPPEKSVPPPDDVVERAEGVDDQSSTARVLPPRASKQTRLDKAPRPTRLVKDEPEDVMPPVEKATEQPTPRPVPTSTKQTQLGKSPTPTMLAKPTQLAKDEEEPVKPADVVKPAEAVMPNLSIDEPEHKGAVLDDAELVSAEEVKEPSGKVQPASSDLSDDDILFAEEVTDDVLAAEPVEPSAPASADDIIDAEVIDAEIADDDEVLSADEVLVVEPSGSALPVELVEDEEVLEAVEVSGDEDVLDADEVVVAGASGSAQPVEVLDEDVIEAAEEVIDADEVVDADEVKEPSATAQREVAGAEDPDDLFAVEEVAEVKEPSMPAAPSPDFDELFAAELAGTSQEPSKPATPPADVDDIFAAEEIVEAKEPSRPAEIIEEDVLATEEVVEAEAASHVSGVSDVDFLADEDLVEAKEPSKPATPSADLDELFAADEVIEAKEPSRLAEIIEEDVLAAEEVVEAEAASHVSGVSDVGFLADEDLVEAKEPSKSATPPGDLADLIAADEIVEADEEIVETKEPSKPATPEADFDELLAAEMAETAERPSKAATPSGDVNDIFAADEIVEAKDPSQPAEMDEEDVFAAEEVAETEEISQLSEAVELDSLADQAIVEAKEPSRPAEVDEDAAAAFFSGESEDVLDADEIVDAQQPSQGSQGSGELVVAAEEEDALADEDVLDVEEPSQASADADEELVAAEEDALADDEEVLDVTESSAVAAADDDEVLAVEEEVLDDEELLEAKEPSDSAEAADEEVVAADEDEEVVAEDEEVVAEDEEVVAEDEEVVAEDEEAVAEDEEVVAEDEEVVAEDEEVLAEDEEVVAEDEELLDVEATAEGEDDEVLAAEEEVLESMESSDVAVDSDETIEMSPRAKAPAGDEDETAAFASFELPKDEDDEGTILDDLDDAPKSPVPRKKGKPVAQDVDLDEALAEETDEIDLGAPPKGKKPAKSKSLSEDDVDLDEIFAESAAEEEEAAEVGASFEEFDDEEAAPKAKKGPAKKSKLAVEEDELGGDEDEIFESAKGGTAVATKKPPKPKYGRRWVGGFALATLLFAGAGGGVWFLKPDLIDEAYQSIPDSPNAQAGMIKGKAAQDLDLKYKGLQKTHADLQAAKTLLEKEKTEGSDEAKKLKEQIDALKLTEKTANDLRDQLVKAKAIPDDAVLKDVPDALKDLLTKKDKADMDLGGVIKALVDGKHLDDKGKFDVADFGKLLKDLADAKTTLTAVNKKLEDLKIKDPGEKGVETVLASLKDATKSLADVDQILKDAEAKETGIKGVKEIVDIRKKLETDRDDLDKVVKAAFKELADASIVPAGADPRKELISGTKTARLRAESPLVVPLAHLASGLSGIGTGTAYWLQRGMETAALAAEVNYYRMREPLIQNPEGKLDTWVLLLQDRQRKDAQELASAVREAEWVRSEKAKAGPEARAKALYVIALSQRNRENFAEAKKALEEAATEVKAVKSPAAWFTQLARSLKEATDVTAYFWPRVEKEYDEGNLKGTLDELEIALKAMPDDGRLLAFRSLVRLEMARPTGKEKIAAEVQQQVRQDAQAALKDPGTAAEGAFVLGRLEEELGRWSQAEDHYRQALLKAPKDKPDEASRYRIALARLLQRDRPATLPQPAPEAPQKEEPKEVKPPKKEEPKDVKKDDPKDKKDDPKKDDDPKDAKEEPKVGRSAHDQMLAALLYLVVVGVQPGAEDDEENAAAMKRLKESIDLAQELIKSKNLKIQAQGYMLLGQAYAKMGRRTEGLKEYVKGLELLAPGAASKDLGKMIEEHPAFNQPDSLARPNPYLAEQHFGIGLHLYWARQYKAAEEQFKQAIAYFDQDARYFYYRGLAEHAQKKRDLAIYSFEQGARLEAANRPTVSEINASLERVQGALRVYLNGFRQKAVANVR